MSITGLTPITNTNTFGQWKDRTNQIIESLEDVVTIGDAEQNVGNVVVTGNISASNTIITDVISPLDNAIDVITLTSFTEILSNVSLDNTDGGIVSISFRNAGVNSWQIRTDVDHDSIIIAKGDVSLTLDAAAGSLTGTNFKIDDGILPNLITSNIQGNVTGNVSGNVTGTVSDISNHDTDDLSEGNNLYFTTTRARGALSSGTGVTYESSTGEISIGQAVGTTNNVTFADATLTGTLTIRPEDNAAIEHGRVDGVASTPFINFHSSGNNIDYDSRIIASGGSTLSGKGALSYTAEDGHTFTGAIVSDDDITAFSTSSDIRKKENIIKIDNALEKVVQISGYTYNFKGDDRKITGVIAQEIEKVLPEVVYEIDDEEFGKSKAVRYGNIVGLLIEAIKELKAEIEELKKG